MKDDDFKLLQGFADGQTDRHTNEQTFVIVELLLRLKIYHTYDHDCISEFLSPPTPPFSLQRIFMKTSQKDKIQE